MLVQTTLSKLPHDLGRIASPCHFVVFVLRALTVTVSTRAMKLALSLLVLVACAHAIPIAKDTRTQPAQVDTPTVIVGSSQVDEKSDSGKVTLHLDQRSQIPEVPVVSVPTTEQVKQPALQPVQVVEEPKQEPVLTVRSDIIPPKSEETIRTEPVVTVPEKTELGARSEPTVPQAAPVQVEPLVQEVPVIRVVEPQVTPQVVPAPPQRPVVIVEEVPVPVIPPQPVVLVVPEVSVPVQVPIIEQDIPQTVVQPVVVVPEVPQTVAVVPTLEVRSTPLVQTSPVISDVVPAKESIEPERKVVPKQGELNARNLKVDQAPVKAPIVISSIQKQIPVTQVKSSVQPQQQVVSQTPKLEGKHAEVVPEVKSEQQSVQPQVQQQSSTVVLEERKSDETIRGEEVKPIRVEPVVVPEQVIRNEPVVIPAVLPQETSIRTTEIREPVQIQPVRVEPLAVPELVIRKEPVVIPIVEPKESVIHTTDIREPVVVQSIRTTEIREPVQVQKTQSEIVPVKSIVPQSTVVDPVVPSQQANTRTTQIRDEPVKVLSLPEEKAQ